MEVLAVSLWPGRVRKYDERAWGSRGGGGVKDFYDEGVPGEVLSITDESMGVRVGGDIIIRLCSVFVGE